MKKFISILLSALLITSVICSAPLTVFAAAEESQSIGASSGTTGDCTWTLDDNGMLTISGNGAMEDYSNKNGPYKTTAPWGTNIKSVVIENGVTSISFIAFSGCKSLTSVIIGNGVKSIGGYAFYGCTGLTSIDIPDSVTSIGSSAFEGCTGLTSVTIGNSVTSIGGLAFSGCAGLTSVVIPDRVGYIGYHAFYDCTGLTSITIPYSVTTIDGLAFGYYYEYDEKKVDDFTIYGVWGSESERYANDNGFAFVGKPEMNSGTTGECTWTLDNEATLTISGKGAMGNNYDEHNIAPWSTGIKNIIIDDGVTSIGQFAFKDCKSLKSVTIPDNITSIGDCAFKGCTGMNSITIPGSVTSIGGSAFYGCKKLTSVTIPDGVTSIGGYAFRGCTGLTSIDIPDSVTSIDSYVFYDCKNLTSITIPDSVTSIGDKAFGYYYYNDRWQYVKVADFMIYGVKGSAAEKYANDNGFAFVETEPKKDQTYTDEETNISVTSDEGLTLKVIEKSETEVGDIVLGQGEAIQSVYDISLLKDGAEVQPDGKVTVKIPCDNDGAKVYRVENDNTLTDMNAVYENGYLVFTTEHFSVYVVSVPKTYTTGDVNGDNVVDIFDATLIQKYAVDKITLTDEQKEVADVNDDGVVDIFDATDIQKFTVEKITEFKKKA